MGHLTTSKGCWGCTRAITRTPGRKKKPELPPPPECLENSRILHKRCENYLIADGMGPRPPMQLYIYVGLLCVSYVGREFMRSRLDPQNEVVYCELQVSQQLATRLEIPDQWRVVSKMEGRGHQALHFVCPFESCTFSQICAFIGQQLCGFCRFFVNMLPVMLVNY